MKIINLENGDFILNSEITIKRNMVFNEVNELNINKNCNDLGNGYAWIYLKKFEINQLYFFINICFFEKKIKMISFSFFEKFENDLTWDNWSEAKELKNQIKFEKWLCETVGEERNFKWGNITSNYDAKSLTSNIVINYLD
ncbi:hypothetical protein [Flavobacterium sp.]|jgi:hypothetical protein|uniref:hypothetical protein n=1 Tax=Flavobacterium sp. TaxID=239 RepID=UPI0022C1682D|nr:hypothetical protein [Flavobacterium sp.]MCZ8091540.1 hypothetical protein [Flavobacterium sp.]